MKLTIISICTIWMVFIFYPGISQNTLDEKAAGKETYREIRDVTEEHYGQIKRGEISRGNLPKYKHWARYSSWISTHLDPEGKMVNVSRENLRYWNSVKNKAQPRYAFGLWSFVGPSNTTGASKGLGRADRIAFHPTNANIIYIGTPAGGLWKTVDGGSTWTPLTDHLPSLGVSGIIVDYTNPNTIFILTGTGDGNGFSSIFNYRQACVGVLKSTDGGDTWEPTGEFPNAPDQYFGYRLKQSPVNPDFLLATTNGGLYRSLDRGQTWNLVMSGQFYDIEFKHTGNKVFVTRGPFVSNCFYSEDSGNSWKEVEFAGTPPDSEGRWELATSPGETCRFYLLCGPDNEAATEFNGLFQLTDCDSTFSRVSTTPNVFGSSHLPGAKGQSPYDIAIAVNPNNGQGHILITGGLVLFRSLNSGQSIHELTDYFEDSNDPGSYIHPDVHDLAYNPLDGKVYAASDGGVYVSSDNGNTWTDLSSGLETSMIYDMAGTPLHDEKLLAGNQDNGVHYRFGEVNTFRFLQTGDGYSVQFSPTNSGEGFTTVNNRVYRWTNSFTDVVEITPPESNHEDHFFPRILVHNTDPNKLICSYAITHYSNNGGSTWTKSTDYGRGFHALVASPSNPDRVYCAGSVNFNDDYSYVYRSDDFGVNWTIISINPGYSTPNARVTGIAVYPNLSTNVWVALGGYTDGEKVFFSSNAGASWTNMTADLPNIVVNCIAVDGYNGAYIGTDQGVFYRNIFSTGWTLFSNRLPRVPVTRLVIDHGQNIIRAATYGRGIWESQLYTSCSNDLWIVSDQKGDYFYQADNSVLISSKQAGGMGTKGYIKAGHHMELLPGFETFPDQSFQTIIGECGTGGLIED